MKKFVLILAMVSLCEIGQAAEQFDDASCRQIKGAVELFLGLADASFKAADALRRGGDDKEADEKFQEAVSMSELVENYANTYTAFCKP